MTGNIETLGPVKFNMQEQSQVLVSEQLSTDRAFSRSLKKCVCLRVCAACVREKLITAVQSD